MSQKTKISKLTHQFNLPNPLEIEKYISPIFSTDNKMFWQLLLKIDDHGSCEVYLTPVANSDEIVWGERSKLSFRLFIEEIRSNKVHTSEHDDVSPDTEIKYGNFLFHIVINFFFFI